MRKPGLVLCAVLLLPLGGCDRAGSGPRGTERARQAAAGDEMVDDVCPGDETFFDNIGAGATVPDSATTSTDCKRFLWNEKEVHLCRAYWYFQRATTLNPTMAGPVTERLKRYRQAAAELARDLHGETIRPDTALDGLSDEPAILDVGDTLRCGSAPFPVEPILYWRGLRLEGLKLYRDLAEHVVYAMTAEADWQRGISGDTATYSGLVWGPEVATFSGIRGGWRGKALGFLVGLDTVWLDALLDAPSTNVFQYCGQPGSDEGETNLPLPECLARYLLPLPGCTADGRPKGVRRALSLLRQYGVALGSEGSISTDGAVLSEFLCRAVNARRESLGLDPFPSPADLLADRQVTQADLVQAGQVLAQERGIYLHNERPVVVEGVPGVLGLDEGRDVQGLLVEARVNASRIVGDDVPWFDVRWCSSEPGAPACPFGYGRIDYFPRHAYFKVLANLRDRMVRESRTPWWEGLGYVLGEDDEARLGEPHEQAMDVIQEEIGNEEVAWGHA